MALISALLLFLSLSSFSTASPDDVQNCSPKFEVVLGIENRNNVWFFDDYCTLTYDLGRNIFINITSATNAEIQVREVDIAFSGFVAPKQDDYKKSTLNFSRKTIVIQREKKDVKGKEEYVCRTSRADNSDLSFDLAPQAEAAIHQFVEACVQSYICENYKVLISNEAIEKVGIENEPKDISEEIGEINDDDLIELLGRHEDSRNDSKAMIACRKVFNDEFNNPQTTVNKMIDFGLTYAIGKLVDNKVGMLELPRIYTNFSTGSGIFKTTGEIEAMGGIFEDLRSLSRTKDLSFEHEHVKFIVGTSYRLEKAKIQFDNYRVRYGIIKIDGHVGVDIDGIAVTVKISFNFNVMPCRAKLMDFNIDELGEIEIDFTGLGWLNTPAERLIKWAIREKTFDSVKDLVSQKISELDCEQFRPSV